VLGGEEEVVVLMQEGAVEGNQGLSLINCSIVNLKLGWLYARFIYSRQLVHLSMLDILKYPKRNSRYKQFHHSPVIQHHPSTKAASLAQEVAFRDCSRRVDDDTG
jgi:hypothetical protein